MPSIGPWFFILGLAVASAVTEIAPTFNSNHDDPFSYATPSPYNTSAITANFNATSDITSFPNIDSNMNITDAKSTIIPSTTNQKNDITYQISKKTTPKPIVSSKTTTTTTKKEIQKEIGTTNKPQTASSDSTGIIILIVIILVAVICGVACYFSRRRGRRYSVDFTTRPDDVNIPLSTVEPEMPADTFSQNGLKTFEPAADEPEAKPEAPEEQKTEADKSVVDPSAESAAPAPSPDSSGDKPKEDKPKEDKPKEDAPEQSPPAPAEPSTVEKTDDKGDVSNKTSVESLKETNENNSNNAAFSQKIGLESSIIFWDVPLDCPV